MKNRIFIGSLATIIYIVLLSAFTFAFLANFERFDLLEFVFHVVVFCGLLPLMTLFFVLKFKVKNEYLKSSEGVIFASLLLHYFYSANTMSGNSLQAFYLLLANILITSIILFFFIRKQRSFQTIHKAPRLDG